MKFSPGVVPKWPGAVVAYVVGAAAVAQQRVSEIALAPDR